MYTSSTTSPNRGPHARTRSHRYSTQTHIHTHFSNMHTHASVCICAYACVLVHACSCVCLFVRSSSYKTHLELWMTHRLLCMRSRAQLALSRISSVSGFVIYFFVMPDARAGDLSRRTRSTDRPALLASCSSPMCANFSELADIFTRLL